MIFKKRRTRRRTLYQSDRWNDPRYKEWRKQVIKRDKRCCRFPGCSSRRRLQTHHIKMWEYYPSLRFMIGNGITLCRVCHERIKGHEDSYIQTFMRIISESPNRH
jgi:hypothetical protein